MGIDLNKLAQFWLAREHARGPDAAAEQAAEAAGTEQLVKKAQLARALQQMKFADAAQPIEMDYKKALADQARGHADYYRNPKTAAAGTLKPIMDDAGSVVGFYSNRAADGGVQFYDAKGQPVNAGGAQAGVPDTYRDRPKPRPPAPPRDRFTFLTDAQGRITGTGNTTTGAVGPVGGTPAAPGAPATVGGTEVRKSSQPAAILGLQMARQRAAPVLQDLGSRALALNAGREGGMLDRAVGAGRGVAGKVGADSAADLYISGIRGFTPLFARSVGHSGVLTEQDVQRTEMLFPRIGDAESVSREKLARLQRIMTGQEPLPFQWSQPSYDDAGVTQQPDAAPSGGGGFRVIGVRQ